MTKHEIVALAVRLFALMVVLYFAKTLIMLIPMIGQPYYPTPLLLVVLGIMVAVVCLYLWVFPLSTANLLLPRTEEDKSHEPIDQKGFMTALVICLGIWVLSYAIPDMLYWIIQLNLSQKFDLGIRDLDSGGAGFYATLLEIMIGLWLTFGSRGIIGFIRYIRRIGTE